MDKDTYILNEREAYIRLLNASQIIDKEFFEATYSVQPVAAHLMLRKFKSFLDDATFVDLERQLALIKFLDCEYPFEVTEEIIDFVTNCNLSADYTKIILDWNYQHSEVVKELKLADYDAAEFTLSKKQHKTRKKRKKQVPEIDKDSTWSITFHRHV